MRVTDAEIDSLLEKAMEANGISRWCSGFQTVKPPKTNENLMMNEAISKGSVLQVHLRDGSTSEPLLKKRVLLREMKRAKKEKVLDFEQVSVSEADLIVQQALFKRVCYPID
ncbi:hypothetical protein IMZ31_23570 (plasmid) [Pontibacillus sp. ALD_SL1]|uniref:hypothetical protein n=1 Tax=Pontibacillus sp. ALD_SL1 TaxID=2777185 RepID=UPI001A95D570|nr:hypothetical protein [Pontibacillus sp. ALD_SL1]QST02431.1 hypothetical protein IMZ31_23570 [Pontibacillus sp. ALD_SL1]